MQDSGFPSSHEKVPASNEEGQDEDVDEGDVSGFGASQATGTSGVAADLTNVSSVVESVDGSQDMMTNDDIRAKGDASRGRNTSNGSSEIEFIDESRELPSMDRCRDEFEDTSNSSSVVESVRQSSMNDDSIDSAPTVAVVPSARGDSVSESKGLEFALAASRSRLGDRRALLPLWSHALHFPPVTRAPRQGAADSGEGFEWGYQDEDEEEDQTIDLTIAGSGPRSITTGALRSTEQALVFAAGGGSLGRRMRQLLACGASPQIAVAALVWSAKKRQSVYGAGGEAEAALRAAAMAWMSVILPEAASFDNPRDVTRGPSVQSLTEAWELLLHPLSTG